MKNKSRAFTLIELLVVVLIIGILAAIAVPQYQKAVLKAQYLQLQTLTHAIANAQEVYYLANNVYSPAFDNLDINSPAFTSQSTPTTSNTRFFPFGSCWVATDEWGDRVACAHEKAKLNYYVYLKHSSQHPGKRMCRAQSTDLGSVQNALCKAETGRNTASPNTSGGFTDWMYMN